METKIGAIVLFHVVVSSVGLTSAQTSASAFKAVQYVGANCTTLKEMTSRNRISCTTACGQSKVCYGVRWSSSGRTCQLLYHDCFSGGVAGYSNRITSPGQTAAGSSSSSSNNETVYRKSVSACQNNGVWVNSTFGCACVDCWVGYYCDRYPKNCSELFSYGYPKATNHLCTLDTAEDGQLLARTTCRIFATGVALTVITMTNDTDVAHNRTWSEYEGGFWNNSRDFFVGLKQIVALNARQGLTTVRTQVDFAAPRGNWTWARENDNFFIQDRSYGYSFTATKSPCLVIDDYTPKTITKTYTLSDLVDLSQNTPFSAYDMDQDNVIDKNCAALAGAGWWFRNCSSTVNPLGTAATVRIPGINMSDPEIQSSFTFFAFYFYNQV